MGFPTDVLEKLIKNLPEALFLEDLNGNILAVNDQTCKLLGYDKEELVDLTVDDLVPEDSPLFLPDDPEGEIETLEGINTRKDGTKVPVELRGRVIEVEGEKRLLVSIRDITEREKAERKLKESKRRFRKLADLLPQPAWETNLQGELTYANQTGYEKLGYSTEELKEGIDMRELVVPEDRERLLSNFKKVLEGEELEDHEYTCLKKDGTTFSALIYSSPIRKDGELVGVRGITLDISRQKQVQQSLKRQREELRQLHHAVDKFQQCETEEDLCNRAIGVTEDIFELDWCAFYCMEGDKLVPHSAGEDLDPEDLPVQDLDEGLAGETYRKGETIAGEDLRRQELATPTPASLKSYMSVPIGEVGVFQAASTRKGGFEETEVELAEILAGHLHEEIKRIRLEGELKEQAIKDPLTSLYNRRYFNESLDKEVERCKRYDNSLAFLMIDVNRFKEINDRYTHQKGDEVLKEVAKLLKDNVRDADTVVRYGGDEFLIMMPKTKKVESTVNRIEDKLKTWNEESDLLDFPLTLAMGTSRWNPDQDRDSEEALKEADVKMYEAKGESNNAGR